MANCNICDNWDDLIRRYQENLRSKKHLQSVLDDFLEETSPLDDGSEVSPCSYCREREQRVRRLREKVLNKCEIDEAVKKFWDPL